MKTIDKYILRRFLINFFLLALAFLMVMIVVDLVENFDKYLDKNAKPEDIVMYYIYFLPWMFVIVSPIGLLLSANFTGNFMAKHNEVVACKSVGISSLRLGRSIYIFGIIWSIFILFFGEMVVPPASQKSEDIKDYKLLKRKERTRVKHNIHITGSLGQTYSIKSYNPKSNTGFEVAIVYFDDSLQVTKRIDARTMQWMDDHYLLRQVYIRNFQGDSQTTKFKRDMKLKTDEKPEDIVKKKIDPDEMGFFDLKKYIEKSISLGRNPSREQTELYVKLTFPFSNFIILIFALPIALHMRKSGAAIGFAISFIVAFLYFSLVRIGQSLGYNESLSPFMAANLGNTIFFILGLIVLYKYRD